MRYLIYILLFISFGARAQQTIGLGSSRPQDINRIVGRLTVDSAVRLIRYASADTNKVLGVDSQGNIVIRTKGNGSGGSTDSAVFATLYALYDTAHNLRGYVNGLFTAYYTASQVNTLLGNYYDKTTSDGKYVNKNFTLNVNGSSGDFSDDHLNLNVGYVPYAGHADNADTSLKAGIADSAKYAIQSPTPTVNQVLHSGNSSDTSLLLGKADSGIISIFGNSITANVYTYPSVPNPFYDWLNNWTGQTIHKHAHGGESYYRGYTPHNDNGGLLDSLAALETMPTANSRLIIELSFNDACQYPSSYDTVNMKLSLDTFIASALTKSWVKDNIAALSSWYIPNAGTCIGATADAFINVNTAIKNECAILGIHYVDLYTLFQNNSWQPLWVPDGFHWSAVGHRLVAEEIQKVFNTKLTVNGAIAVSGGLYDGKGNQIINTDALGNKIIEGHLGISIKPTASSIVNVPYNTKLAGVTVGGVGIQGLSIYQNIVSFNAHYTGTGYVSDTSGFSQMIQSQLGEFNILATNTEATGNQTISFEKRFKIGPHDRLCGFGGQPSNNGVDDFRGSAIVTNTNTIRMLFPTKITASQNTSNAYDFLVQNTDTTTEKVSSIPYSRISSRLKYNGTANYIPVFNSSDTLTNSDIRDSAGYVSINENPLPNAFFAVKPSDSFASAMLGYTVFQSISAGNQSIRNNAIFKNHGGSFFVNDGYDFNLSFANSANSGGFFGMYASPYPGTAGTVINQQFPYFKLTNWGTLAFGYQNNNGFTDTTNASLIITTINGVPNSQSQIFAPNVPVYSGSSKKYAVFDATAKTAPIPTNKLTYVTAIPVADVTGAIPYTDTLNRKIATKKYVDSVAATISGGGSGTVTSTSVVTANGFAGTVATATTTPAITLTTTVTGLLKGNATAISAATSGTDYLAPNSTITGATHTKITYDAKGLVTAGADATTADIAASTNKNYVTDAQQTVIGNTSGTNTGDQTTITGNAGTATTLQTSRNIYGNGFNGSADISAAIAGTYGGTGVNNGAKTITVSGNTSIGSSTNTVALATSGNTSVTLPTSGTLATLAGSETLTNKTITTPVIASISNTGTITVPTVTGTIVQYSEAAITSSSTPAPTGDARENYLDVTSLAAAATFSAPSGTAANHNLLYIRIKDNATSRTLAWNAIYRAGTDFALPTATTISKTVYVQFMYNSADSKWDCIGTTTGFSIPLWLLLMFTPFSLIRSLFKRFRLWQ